MSSLPMLNAAASVGELSEKFLFEWNVPYAMFLDGEVNRRIKSPEFEFQKAKWCLDIYPNGETTCGSPGCIGLYLSRVNSVVKEQHIIFRINIGAYNELMYSASFTSSTPRWGTRSYMAKQQLIAETPFWVERGIVKVLCIVDAKIKENTAILYDTIQSKDFERLLKALKEKFMIFYFSSDLLTDIKELVEAEDGYVAFNVKNKQFLAHKAVVRDRSPDLFNSVFSSKSKNNSGKYFTVGNISDCDPKTFEDLLHFLYCGTVEFSIDRAFGLYSVAGKYKVEKLKSKCVDFIFSNITLNTFFDAFTLAQEQKDPKPSQVVSIFFAKHSDEIINSAQWLPFQKENPVKAKDLFLTALQIMKDHYYYLKDV